MADTDSDTDTSSSSDSGSEVDAVTRNALYRSYFKFTVSQDPHNQSFLTPSQFAQLDLYQTDALRDDDDPLGLSREMQGATHHFPCHVFWSTELATGKYAVWGRATVGQHEQETVIRMLEVQRKEREEYKRLVSEQKWQRECERKVQAYSLERSAALASRRANARRTSDAAAAAAAAAAALPPPSPEPLVESAPTGRIASIVHRIARREDDAPVSETQAASMVNRDLKRLGLKALAVGSIALVSAVAYLQWLQTQSAGSNADDDTFSILPSPPELAAHAGVYSSSSVTDRVFAAHQRRHRTAPQVQP